MLNPIQLGAERKAWYTKIVPIEKIQSGAIDNLERALIELKKARKQYYRLFFYLRKEWNTGFSSRQLTELRQNFANIQTNEKHISNYQEYLLSELYEEGKHNEQV